jgi:hypothetical protein
MPISTESIVAWAAGILAGGGVILILTGARRVARTRHSRTYFRQRRQRILHGWRAVAWGAGLLLAGGAVALMGRAAIQTVIPPTPTSPPSPTPPATATITPTPTISPIPSQTPIPSNTLPPSETPPATITPTPTIPSLPSALLTPLEGATVTPPAGAVIANLRMSAINECGNTRGNSATFGTRARTLYALFDYNDWLPGAQWSNVWVYNGQVVHTETLLWDGSTGGCGYAEYDNAGADWAEGVYEVQIFIGAQWLGSTQFVVASVTPTP